MPEIGQTSKWRLDIIDCAVTVTIEIDSFIPAHFMPHHTKAFEIIRTCLNVVSFSNGMGYSIVIDRFIDDKGQQGSVTITDPLLVNICPAYSYTQPDEMYRFMRHVYADHTLFLALNDLIDANVVPQALVINCGRVVDGIRNVIAPKEDRSKAWPKMHKSLNVSQGYQEFISKTSTEPRHGNRDEIPAQICRELLNRTWTLMNRLLIYIDRGKLDLLPPEFPTL